MVKGVAQASRGLGTRVPAALSLTPCAAQDGPELDHSHPFRQGPVALLSMPLGPGGAPWSVSTPQAVKGIIKLFLLHFVQTGI